MTRGSPSLFAVLRRRALIVIAVTLLCGAAAGFFAYATQDNYESTAKLLFRQGIGPEYLAQGLQPNTPDADQLAQDNVELVASRRVAEATSEELRGLGVDMSTEDVEGDVAVSGTREDSDVVHVMATASSARRAGLLATTYSENAVRLARIDERRQVLRSLRNKNEQLRQLRGRQALLPRRLRDRSADDRLRSDIEDLRTLAAVGTGSPRIIQSGFVPTSESGSPVQTIALGLLFGLILGVGLALLREQADRRLRRAEEVSAAFDAPVLTTVPRARPLKRRVPFADLPPDVAEAFRMLHMNLRYAQSEPVRSVVVTSSRSGQGKTTVAWNLASAAASSGLSVALVETDMRRPRIAERYDLDSGPGLAEALRDEVPVVEALQSVAMTGHMKGNGRPSRLQVLVAGEPPPDPWALMQSPSMERVLGELRRNHDLVVIDTPPIPYVADAFPVLRLVDGVLVTASVKSIRGAEAARLRDQLQALDARILGVVANGGSATDGYGYAPAAAPAATVHE